MPQLKKRKTTDDYQTDKWLKYGLFDGWFDPCPFMGLDDPSVPDGLAIPWKDHTFVNPPYSNPLPWVKKGIEESEMGGFTIAFLLKHDSSTQWYRLLHEVGAHFLPIIGRLQYGTGAPAPFASIVAILGGSEALGWEWEE